MTQGFLIRFLVNNYPQLIPSKPEKDPPPYKDLGFLNQVPN